MSWDGRMYKKYRVEHTDGTPLKGKSYFVLRLDSDNPVEAARVDAAMRAYKGELRNCDVGTPDEQAARYYKFCSFQGNENCNDCSLKSSCVKCEMAWAQMPYENGKIEPAVATAKANEAGVSL